MALYHHVNESTLHTIRKADKKRMENCCGTTTSEDCGLEIEIESTDSFGGCSKKMTSVSGEETKQLGEILPPLMEHLKVGQKVLLAVAWVRDDERRLFELYPEVLMMDVTYGTNREGRPLGTSCSFDQNMNIFSPFRAFLPSECQWVFQWLWEIAIPKLLPIEALRRVQVVLTDGDSKIYNAFNAVRDKFYPNAIHALCIFHLVTQPLSKLSEIRSRDTATIKGMLLTFKLWVFSWMGYDGVESEQEYEESKAGLERWLASFAYRQDLGDEAPDLVHNARVLNDFLTTKIIPHKTRFLFPGRGRRMTLGQKATSALECLHRVMKNKKGISVAPNMSLAKSYRTQNQQVDARMRQYNIKTAESSRSRCLFSRFATANAVTKECECQIIQQKEQSYFYACRVESPYVFWFQRLPDASFFCEQCDENAAGGIGCCSAHSTTSPITRFRRNRRVWIRWLRPDMYEVVCSCFYHPVYGIPCRHVAAILEQILPEHVHVRWMTNVAQFYRDSRDHCWTHHFSQRKGERRLIINEKEYRQLHQNAVRLQEQHARTLPKDFWTNIGSFTNCNNGMVSFLVSTGEDDGDDFGMESFLSVDVCLSQDAQADNDSKQYYYYYYYWVGGFPGQHGWPGYGHAFNESVPGDLRNNKVYSATNGGDCSHFAGRQGACIGPSNDGTDTRAVQGCSIRR